MYALSATLGQSGKQAVDELQRFRAAFLAHAGAQPQILLDRHIGKQIARLRNLHHAATEAPMRRQTNQLPPAQLNGTSGRPNETADGVHERRLAAAVGAQRSEEHTSELPSLMRFSYAVFCMK